MGPHDLYTIPVGQVGVGVVSTVAMVVVVAAMHIQGYNINLVVLYVSLYRSTITHIREYKVLHVHVHVHVHTRVM